MERRHDIINRFLENLRDGYFSFSLNYSENKELFDFFNLHLEAFEEYIRNNEMNRIITIIEGSQSVLRENLTKKNREKNIDFIVKVNQIQFGHDIIKKINNK